MDSGVINGRAEIDVMLYGSWNGSLIDRECNHSRRLNATCPLPARKIEIVSNLSESESVFGNLMTSLHPLQNEMWR